MLAADNLHVTLRFLGETEHGRLGELMSGIDDLAHEHSAFGVATTELGGFPTLRRAQAIWVGLHEREQEGVLRPLQKEVEGLARRLGWHRQRQTFVPHVTLGRVGSRQHKGRFGEGGPPSVPDLGFEMTALTLFQSDLTPAGAHYRALHRCAFGAAGPAGDPTSCSVS